MPKRVATIFSLRRSRRAVFFAFFALSLVACGSSGGTSSTAPSLTGTWTLACSLVSDSLYESIVYVFGSSNFTKNRSEFQNSSCSDKISASVSSGTYSVGDQLSSDIYEIDFGFQRQTLAIFSASTVSAYNSSSTCGGDWQTGVAKTLTNDCSLATEVDTDVPDLLEIKTESSSSAMYLGRRSDGDSSQTRPTEIETDLAYKKS